MPDYSLTLWLSTIAVFVIAFVVLAIKTSPQLAIGIVSGLAMILPAWLILPLFDTPRDTMYGSGIDAKFTILLSCLFLYCFLPGRTFPFKLVLSDFCMIALVVVHFISDILNAEFSWMIPARIYAEWFAPYVAGRLSLQKLEVSDWLWKILAIASVFVGFAAVLEAISGIKIYELIAGQRPIEGFSRDAERWGVLRAYGPAMHAIYFGGLQLLLLAWPAFTAAQAIRGRIRPRWIFIPLIPIAGIVATASRAPILGIFVFAFCILFIVIRKSRLPIAIAFAVTIAFTSFSFTWLVEKLEDWSGESRTAQYSRVKIDGEKVTMSGTRGRLLMFDVYRIAINRSGFFGYGTIATTSFPIDVPVVGQEPETLKRIKYIDNTYLLFLFRFGYFGVACFIAACLASLWQFYTVANAKPQRSIHVLSSMLAASLAAVYFLIATVWLPPDISYPMLWTMGISSGLYRALLQNNRP